MSEDTTHFIFDGQKIILSQDLTPIFNFLKGIETEVETFLSYEKRLNQIKKQHLDTLKLIEFLSKKMIENNINIDYKFEEDLASTPFFRHSFSFG